MTKRSKTSVDDSKRARRARIARQVNDNAAPSWTVSSLLSSLTGVREETIARILATIALILSLPLFIFLLFGAFISLGLGLEDVGFIALVPALILWTVLLCIAGYAVCRSVKLLFSS